MPPILPFLPSADRPRCRPTLVQYRDGTACVYIEIAMDPATVHLSMSSEGYLRQNCQILGHDVGQSFYDFVRRTRPTYLEWRTQ